MNVENYFVIAGKIVGTDSRSHFILNEYRKVPEKLIRVIRGIPDDLLYLVHVHRDLHTVVNLFPAESEYTLAFIKKAEEQGILRLTETGEIHLKEETTFHMISLEAREEASGIVPTKIVEAFRSLMLQCCCGKTADNKCALPLRPASCAGGKGARIMYALPEGYPVSIEAKGDVAKTALGNVKDYLQVRGSSLGVHDLVITHMVPGWEEACMDFISANLRAYGTAIISYTPFLMGAEGWTIDVLLSVMHNKHDLYTTHISSSGLCYFLRCVKFPEMVDLRQASP